MANRNFPASRVFGMHLLPVRLDAQVAIGATGAPTLSNGVGIASISRLAAGIYRIQLQDNYSQFLSAKASFGSPVTGSAVLLPSITPGVMYQITTLGAATAAQWITAGVPVGITPAVGVVFLAAATSAGTSSAVKAVGSSGIASVEVMGVPSTMLSYQPATPLVGAFITVKCLAPLITMGAYTPTGTISAGNIPVATGTAGDAVTNNAGVLNSVGGQDLTVDAQTFTGAAASLTGTIAYSAADPTDGSTLYLEIWLNNSSIQ